MWEAEDLDGELCRGAGVGAAGRRGRQFSHGGTNNGWHTERRGFSRELVDGVVEVTGVRFIWEMSKSSQSSVSWAVPTRLK